MALNPQRLSIIQLKDLDMLCVQAAHPLEILPALGGLGAPYWDFSLKPVIKGQTDASTPADWAAGLTHGIAFLMADIVQYMKMYQIVPAGSTTVSGGLSQSDYLMQFQADVLQRSLTRTAQPEETLIGAALLSGMAESTGATEKTFGPRISPSQAQDIYSKWQTFVKECNAKPL